jgi:hypothetical protein
MASGATMLAAAIQREGRGIVFSLGGVAHGRLLDALDQAGVRIIRARHETAAVAAADGYARITDRVGFAIIISKQGLPNAVAGIRAAALVCSPVVVLVVQPPLATEEPGSSLDDELVFVRPLVKRARTVPAADRLAEDLHHACHLARSGRPGLVVLAIPQDQLSSEGGEPTGSPLALPAPRNRPVLPSRRRRYCWPRRADRSLSLGAVLPGLGQRCSGSPATSPSRCWATALDVVWCPRTSPSASRGRSRRWQRGRRMWCRRSEHASLSAWDPGSHRASMWRARRRPCSPRMPSW